MGTPAAVGRAGGWRPQSFGYLSQIVFIRSLSNLVYILVCIMSRPTEIPQALLYYGPLIFPKLGFPLSKAKSVCLVFIKLGNYVGGYNI